MSDTKNLQIQKAKQLLKDNGYFIDNLWQIADVQEKYQCDDDMAQYILEKSLTNEATMEQIWLSIDIFADLEKLTPKKEEEEI